MEEPCAEKATRRKGAERRGLRAWLRGRAVRRTHLGGFLVQAAVLGSLYMIYQLIRSLSGNAVGAAYDNAGDVIAVQKELGIFVELRMQVAFRGLEGLMEFLQHYYVWGHFPLIVALTVWGYFRHPRVYRWARNAIFLSWAIALLGYLAYPVAPPRLLPGFGFIDAVGSGISRGNATSWVNDYAAMPSMHQGFSLIVGVALYRIVRGPGGALLAMVPPTVMFLTIVGTANHYILDAVAGAAVAVVGMALAAWWEQRRRRGGTAIEPVPARVAAAPSVSLSG